MNSFGKSFDLHLTKHVSIDLLNFYLVTFSLNINKTFQTKYFLLDFTGFFFRDFCLGPCQDSTRNSSVQGSPDKSRSDQMCRRNLLRLKQQWRSQPDETLHQCFGHRLLQGLQWTRPRIFRPSGLLQPRQNGQRQSGRNSERTWVVGHRLRRAEKLRRILWEISAC